MDTTLIKAVAKFAVSVGNTVIVNHIIRSTVHPKTVPVKLAVVASAFVIGCILDDVTDEYMDRQIDELAAFYETKIRPRFQK